jgi:hypothetical protein
MQQDPWDALGNGRTPHLNLIAGKNRSDIGGGHGYLGATELAALGNCCGGIAKPHNNRITFSITAVTFLGGKPSKKELQNGDEQVVIPHGNNCSEHAVYKKILPSIGLGQHLAIRQSKAPCTGCLNKLQGLAIQKQINIYVLYDDAYDILNKPNGSVFISDTGRVSWQA